MKTTSLVILCIYMCVNTSGQHPGGSAIADRVPGESKDSEKSGLPAYTNPVYPEKLKNEDKLSRRSRLPGQFRVQKSNFSFLITDAPVIGFFNLQGHQVSAGNILKVKPFHGRNQFITCSRLALTRLAIIAGNISFMNSLKKENKAGLKLACQKTSFGAPNKACKKVTGITFAISI